MPGIVSSSRNCPGARRPTGQPSARCSVCRRLATAANPDGPARDRQGPAPIHTTGLNFESTHGTPPCREKAGSPPSAFSDPEPTWLAISSTQAARYDRRRSKQQQRPGYRPSPESSRLTAPPPWRSSLWRAFSRCCSSFSSAPRRRAFAAWSVNRRGPPDGGHAPAEPRPSSRRYWNRPTGHPHEEGTSRHALRLRKSLP